MRLFPVTLAVAALFGCSSDGPVADAASLIIKDVTIVSAGGEFHTTPTNVVINNDRIVYIGDEIARRTDATTQIIDGDGKFLSPGLIDGHTHLAEIPGMTFEHEQKFPAVADAAREQIPRSYLFHGFTTVVDLNSEPTTIERWNAKKLRPQAYFCGAAPVFDGYPMSFMPQPLRYRIMPYFLFDESRADEFPDGFEPDDHTPGAIATRIANDGGICIKTHYEKGFGGRGNLPVPTTELVLELVAAAAEHSLPVLIHTNSQEAQSFAVDTGVDAFAHGMWTWNDRTQTELQPEIAAIVDRAIDAGVALQPTIQVLYGEQDLHNPDYLADPRLRDVVPQSLLDWYTTDDGQWWKKRMLQIPIVAQLVDQGLWAELDAPPIARASATLGYFAANGGRLLFGSDTPSDPTFANPPGLNGRLEMSNWIAAGGHGRAVVHCRDNGKRRIFWSRW